MTEVTRAPNGAESIARTLVANNVDVCFTNPGTSEMHFVAALDKVEGMRCILGLFEGVVTGAADGFFRISDRPASTLLHLGPGLANGLANLHNARKAGSAIVNIVGEHATYHKHPQAPLTADIETLARPMSHWVHTTTGSEAAALDAARAIEAARTAPGQIATLILPADASWGQGSAAAQAGMPQPRRAIAAERIGAAAAALRKGDAVLLLGGLALREKALALAGRIAAKTNCRLLCEAQNARLQRGAGRVQVGRISSSVDAALEGLAGTRHMVLAGAKVPVAFFAYPGKPGHLAPPDCTMTRLAEVDEDLEGALEALAEELGASHLTPVGVAPLSGPALPHGRMTPDGVEMALGALMPPNAVIVDESISTGRGFFPQTAGAPPHEWLSSMGASIGYALPVAVGAAIAAPDRKVIALSGDGSAMYTLQALWTMAREKLDVIVVIFANRSYRILHGELARVGAGNPGRKALDMLTLDRPNLDWIHLAKGHGVEAGRAENLEAFASQLRRGLACEGPYLIEAVI